MAEDGDGGVRSNTVAERDANGRFVKGKSGNPKGRAPRETEQQYKDAFTAAVSPEEWIQIIEAAKALALKGDKDARKWLGDYIVGVPTQRTEINATINGALPVEVYDYEAAIAVLAPGSMEDS